jgi:hypothetical protein
MLTYFIRIFQETFSVQHSLVNCKLTFWASLFEPVTHLRHESCRKNAAMTMIRALKSGLNCIEWLHQDLFRWCSSCFQICH